MSAYSHVRDWVDRSWAGTNYRVVLAPVILPALPMLWLGGNTGIWLFLMWAALWFGFVMWRAALHMRAVMAEMKDEPYDRVGKYRLSKEYWATESAAAARYRKKKKNG